ncbi:hypothetical protein LPTSP3_g34840 [Leptospira kobayashii]|uniref:HTH tetR-type domain-containing protein n=1 Tax=Leptospira kobayashii TaxID=1917830 RepID=A0ABN6KH15_9LEPT|nr:TetR/AcrR family transcriptional regulator [Leptospira kobayashii]BDA80554.1 hypothetical protein LPTSP3_g34840 [Leptospira kobayashii]
MKKGEITKQLIIEKSAPIFNRQGYHNASLSDLMEATGLEKGGIYRHFASKEELACEAFDYAIRYNSKIQMEVLEECETSYSKLETFIKIFTTTKSLLGGGCPVFNTAVENDDGNPVLKKKALTAYNNWIQKLTKIAEEAKKEGSLKETVNTETLVIFILTSLEGALIAKNLSGQRSILIAMGEELISYLETKKR